MACWCHLRQPQCKLWPRPPASMCMPGIVALVDGHAMVLGGLCACRWATLATYLELAVSTTHSVSECRSC